MIYVLYGENIDEINKFVDKISLGINKITYDYIDNIDDVIEECSYNDLFGESKVVVLNNSIFLTSKESLESESLNKYLDNPNPNVTLIFKVYDKLDERKSLVKTLKSKFKVKEFKQIDKKTINSYLTNYFSENGYKIDYSAIKEIESRIIDNISCLNNELEKLLLYKIDTKVITIDDVKNVVIKYDNNIIYNFVDALLKRDIIKTFEIYEELKKNKEDANSIIALLASQFNAILSSKLLISNGMNPDDISKKLGIHPYRVELALRQKISTDDIKKLIIKLANVDYNIKSGLIDGYNALEDFLLYL